MNFRSLISEYVFGGSASNLQDIAVKGLEEGFDSPSLCILAGLEKNETPSVIDYYFKQTLKELNIPLPAATREGALEYAVAIVDEIIAGRRKVIEGTGEIVENVLMRFDFFMENKIYCFDSIGFEMAYGLYDTHDELSKADVPWQIGKTNEQLMTEVEEQLLDEMIKWKAKISQGYNFFYKIEKAPR